MATKKKMLQAAAGNAGGEVLNVEDVFSTYLYEGTGANQTITNGIDLAGEGGLVWIKQRTGTKFNQVQDTEVGVSKRRWTNETSADADASTAITSFNSNGFSIGNNSVINTSGSQNASWTFRKAPKFFDVVTYTGNGTAGRTISHNLGAAPGVIIVKSLSQSLNSNWIVYHKEISASQYGKLNSTDAFTSSFAQYYWGNGTNTVNPTSTEFTVGDTGNLNGNGETYVAYLFAHNDGDGEFGPDGDADIIKCGSYTSGGTDHSPEIDLGFEPQWVMIKSTTNADPWVMIDTMRGFVVNYGTGEQDTPVLKANDSAAESATYRAGYLTSTGFFAGQGTDTNENGQSYIYIAIRRGTKVPESGTEVFDVDLVPGSSGPTYTSSFPVDMATTFRRSGGDDWYTSDRLRGPVFVPFNTTGIEFGFSSFASFDYSAGFSRWDNTAYSAWMWKRAPGFFDAIAYKGLGALGSINHNLTVEPEMVWFKNREDESEWICWHKDFPSGNHLRLNEGTSFYTGVLPTNFSVSDTQIIFGNSNAYQFNSTSWNYIAYLFASLPGVSKVGSYAGNNGSQTIDCGFTSGARFVLIRKTSGNGSWYIFDTRRGIVSGNDPYLQLNVQSAEDTFGGKDVVDPHSSGFIVNQTTLDTNASGEDYIFYAIA